MATIAPAVDRQRGTIAVERRIPSPPPSPRPDMTTSVEIVSGLAKQDGFVLPDDAPVAPGDRVRPEPASGE